MMADIWKVFPEHECLVTGECKKSDKRPGSREISCGEVALVERKRSATTDSEVT